MAGIKRGEAGHEEAVNKWRASIAAKYGSVEEYARMIGRKGGHNSRGENTGFALNSVGKDGLTGRERARICGQIGGKASKRTK